MITQILTMLARIIMTPILAMSMDERNNDADGNDGKYRDHPEHS